MAVAVGITVAVAVGLGGAVGAFVEGSVASCAAVSLNVEVGVVVAPEIRARGRSRNQFEKTEPLNWTISHPSKSVLMRSTVSQASNLAEKTGVRRCLLTTCGISAIGSPEPGDKTDSLATGSV